MEDILKNNKAAFVSMLLFVTSLIYVGWQVCGLRYTTHDDIYFDLYSWVFEQNPMDFAAWTARAHARLQAYINMPIILGVDGLSTSYLYDVLNIGTFWLLCIGFLGTLLKLSSVRNAATITAVVLLLFPLHYYFTFPQGYPVMAAWPLSLALLSSCLLLSHVYNPSRRNLAISVTLFAVSLWGAEYNFVLHPTLLVCVAAGSGLPRRRKFFSVLAPYVVVWVVCVIAYISFSVIARSDGGDLTGRVTASFNLVTWLQTFLILQSKAFLPTALWDGVHLVTATGQGVPSVPANLNYFSLLQSAAELGSVLLIVLLAWIFSSTALFWQNISQKEMVRYLVILIAIGFIPALIVSVSAQYQKNVLSGYIQGHLVSFYSYIGLAGLLFLLLSSVCNIWSSGWRRIAAITMCSFFLSACAGVTFLYNNLNRQVMSANRQKWDAARDLVFYLKEHRPELGAQGVYAPAFWTVSGVSGIPGDSVFNGENYWTEYSRAVLQYPVKFLDIDYKPTSRGVFATYFATPAGVPLVTLYEQQGGADGGHFTLLSSKPVKGTLLYQLENGQSAALTLDKWYCDKYCTMRWNGKQPAQPKTITFRPSDPGPANLMAQFFLGRGGEYGNPVRNPAAPRVINWGPRSSPLGTVPNTQSDGSAGVWIQLAEEQSLGEVQVLFAGRAARSTLSQPKLITAAIEPGEFDQAGAREVAIRQLSTGKIFVVGTFLIEPAR